MLKEILIYSWRNLWRNRRRTLFTLTALAMGIAVLIFFRAYITGLTDNTVEAIIKTDSGHIKIADPEFVRFEQMMPKDHLLTGLPRLRRRLAETAGVTLAMERIKFHVLLGNNDRSEPAIAVGVDPEVADRVMGLAQAITRGAYFAAQKQELIIGDQLAKKLRIRAGQELLLVTSDINYSTYALTFKVAGVFATGFPSLDKHLLFIPLAKAREMLDCGDSAHEILVFVSDPGEAPRISVRLRGALDGDPAAENVAVIPWQENLFVKNFVPTYRKVTSTLLNIIMLIVGLVILNTMLMAVMERYQEIGVIKALGFQSREVAGMIFIEALVIGTVGAATGGLIGGVISAVTSKTGINLSAMMDPEIYAKIDFQIPMFGKLLYPRLTSGIFVESIIFGILIALLAVLYPAYKSARMTPVEAFRTQLKV